MHVQFLLACLIVVIQLISLRHNNYFKKRVWLFLYLAIVLIVFSLTRLDTTLQALVCCALISLFELPWLKRKLSARFDVSFSVLNGFYLIFLINNYLPTFTK